MELKTPDEVAKLLEEEALEEAADRKRKDRALGVLIDNDERLNDWEYDFMEDISKRFNAGNYRLTPRQEVKLFELADKYRR